jgi:lysophospholipase L1-like esterase
MIGDSTVADFISDGGLFNGWGQGIYGYFKPTVQAVNLAMPMYSTKQFLNQAELTTMLKIKPDYVLVQFGWFDAYINSPGIGTTLQEYAANLKTIVETIRGFNGIPILITPPILRQFDGNGKALPTVPERCAVVKEVAAELQVHLIDLQQLMIDLYSELGDSGSAYISSSDTDKGHYSAKGAQVIAGLVVNALPDSLGTYLVGILDRRPTP